mgnify:CR=1 FL=1
MYYILQTCVEDGICYEPVCTGRIDGTYADTTHDCVRSFTCKGGMLEKVNSCPPGEKYNGRLCVPSQLQKCEKPQKTAAAFFFRSKDECKSLEDGSHVVKNTNCKNVRICLRGKTTAAFECPTNERFNGHRCLPKELVPCDDICSNKMNGIYPDEYIDCQGYYFCLDGKVIEREQCFPGTGFNGFACVPKHLVSCSKKSFSTGKCVGLRDGFHPDYSNNCKNYFYCHNHDMVIIDNCPEGSTYNGKRCVENSEILCEGPKEMKECDNLPPGLYQNKTSGCTNYFYCNSGFGTKLSCEEGRIFNGYKCVNMDEYTCSSPDVCDDEPDGYKQDKNTACRSYYFCSNGNKITYVCPDGFIFNGNYCVSQDTYECPFSPSKDCVGKADGYHPDRLSNCKKYHYCLKGEKLNTLTCGGKKIFNGRGCVLEENPESVCYDLFINPCSHKEDGVYSDYKSDCRKYYTCKNEMITNENWCPENYGFNGNTCLKNFNCKSTVKYDTSCDGKPIGFYKDLTNDCKTYYFCFWNAKIIGVCPKGTIFNGHICIDSNYYKCPSGET